MLQTSKGFLTIPALGIVFVLILIGAVSFFVLDEREETVEVAEKEKQEKQDVPQVEEQDDDFPLQKAEQSLTPKELSPGAEKKIPYLKKDTAKSITDKVIDEKAQDTSKNISLREQFDVLDQELAESGKDGLSLSPDHAERIQQDLQKLEDQGYPIEEIERLREIVLELSPYLKDAANLSQGSSPPSQSYSISPSGWDPPGGCSGDAVSFTSSPVDEERITFITPLGRMNGSHVTPTDHGYINVGENIVASVRSPAAGEIVDIGTFHGPNDFRVTLWHSCTVSTIYIHLTELAPEIRAHVGDLQPGDNWFADSSNPLYVKAGETIGTMRRSVDFSVHDTNVILSGFVSPQLYYGEPWKIHTVDLYDYFAEPLRTTLRGKSERTVAPIGGKIDHDIDGRLVGSWFLEGAGGYSGEPGEYWLTHLAIAYDHVTPSLIQISDPRSSINDKAGMVKNPFDVCNMH